MQGFIDYLTFRSVISPHVLLACYYIGALGVPVGSWFFARRIKNKYLVVSDIYESSKTIIFSITKTKDRMLFYVLFAMLFFCMEIIWRMVFEFLIAYFQMRDVLLELATH
ncbi:MAG: hypothetical protein CVU54_11695 [Deltaproteobacteria bacterium HGW-Deltaproteobacteria-12]|jgi:hypothetical protein|nr:MAG: hypothetical protein CVU54_11695 [Deltaproteobacteria bacterium HGW-Deltaproteobacteria-12]